MMSRVTAISALVLLSACKLSTSMSTTKDDSPAAANAASSVATESGKTDAWIQYTAPGQTGKIYVYPVASPTALVQLADGTTASYASLAAAATPDDACNLSWDRGGLEAGVPMTPPASASPTDPNSQAGWTSTRSDFLNAAEVRHHTAACAGKHSDNGDGHVIIYYPGIEGQTQDQVALNLVADNPAGTWRHELSTGIAGVIANFGGLGADVVTQVSGGNRNGNYGTNDVGLGIGLNIGAGGLSSRAEGINFFAPTWAVTILSGVQAGIWKLEIPAYVCTDLVYNRNNAELGSGMQGTNSPHWRGCSAPTVGIVLGAMSITYENFAAQ